MKSTITITAVVLVHAAVLSLIGCRSTSGFPEQNSSMTAYSGRYVPPSAAAPSAAVSAPATSEAVITPTAPAPARDASGSTYLVVTPEGTTPATGAEKGEGRTYTVKRNESLWLIAHREGISVKALREANGLPENAVLKENQKIIIPASTGENVDSAAVASTDVSGDVYVVQKGDVLGTIARKHGTTVAKLKSANNLKNDVVRVGQKLRLPGGSTASQSVAAPASAKTTPAPAPAPATTTTPPTSAPAPAAPAAAPDIAERGFGGFGVAVPQARPAPAPAPSTPVPATSAPAPAAPVAPAESTGTILNY